MQAATATMCRSKAWDSKIVVSVWWVYAHQVSKSPPAGLYIPAGSFMIYGKKNFIYPPRLEMGITLLYALDQQSIVTHAEDRR
jgi:predicted ribosome quality control (RQC) complex YloA/Tae2 family protein